MAITTKDYIKCENILNEIHKNYIALPEDATRLNNKLLRVLNTIIQKMKEKDELFKYLYRELYFGGSYYDGSKISHPNEYDIDLVFDITKKFNVSLKCSECAGFVYITYQSSIPDVSEGIARKINKLMDAENYLSTEKVFNWLESLVQRCMNDFPKKQDMRCIDFEYNNTTEPVTIKVIKSKPALTLKLKMVSQPEVSVDLVGCFKFYQSQWPKTNYKANPVSGKDFFFVVPKSPKKKNLPNLNKYWRLSFQEQEKVLMSGDNFKSLKPALRIIKKIRDKYNHPVPSYFIKTVFLWTIDEKSNEIKFWDQPIAVVFMEMLKKYTEHMQNNQIRYYWNKDFNLLETVPNAIQIGNTLKNIINDIDRKITSDRDIIANYILTKEELDNYNEHLNKSPATNNVDTVDFHPPILNLTANEVRYLEGQIHILEQIKITENKQITDQLQNVTIIKTLQSIENKIDSINSRMEQLTANIEMIKSYMHL